MRPETLQLLEEKQEALAQGLSGKDTTNSGNNANKLGISEN